MEQGRENLKTTIDITQLTRYETFDRFVDLALDGVITMDEAILGYQELYTKPADVPGDSKKE